MKRMVYLSNTRKLFTLSLPIFISQLSFSGMGVADVIMAGLVSDDAVSAIAIGNSIAFPLFLFCVGILNAITPTVSYLNGAKQRHLIAHQIRQGYYLVGSMSLILFVIFAQSSHILTIMQTPQSFAGDAIQYLKVMAWGIFPALLNVNLRCFNDGLSNTKPAMYIAFIGLLLNVILNYLFIFGFWFIPAMGVIGCAVATVIVNYIMVILLIIYIHQTPKQQDINLFAKIVEKPTAKTLLKFLRIGTPIAFAIFAEIVLFTSSSLFLAPLGASVVASHQIALQTSSVMFMLPLSFAGGVSILVGKELGKGRAECAKQISIHALITAVLFACLTATIIFTFRNYIPHLFTKNEHSVMIASSLLIFAGIYQIPDAMQAIASGVLRGYKHTKPLLYTTLVCYWCIGIPFGFILARTDYLLPAMGAQGMWVIFCIALSLAALIFWILIIGLQRLPKTILFTQLEKNK